MRPWDDVIPPFEQRIYAAAGYGSSQPLGRRPVLLVVDTNYAFAGRRPRPIEEAVREYRTSCGEAAWAAIAAIRRLLPAARSAGGRLGLHHRTTPRLPVDDGAVGCQERAGRGGPGPGRGHGDRRGDRARPGRDRRREVAPRGFFGTDLAAHLVLRRADTVLIAGGTTSGCVRATVMDAFSLGYRVGVVQECTFDRALVPHKVDLFDMHAKYANVLALDQALAYLATAGERRDRGDRALTDRAGPR